MTATTGRAPESETPEAPATCSSALGSAAAPEPAVRVSGPRLIELLGRGCTYVPDEVLAAVVHLAVPAYRLAEAGEATGNGVTDHEHVECERDDRGLDGRELIGREITDARWAVTSAALADRTVGDLPTDWIGEELELIEAVERVKAWADFQGLAALARLRDAVGQHCEALLDNPNYLDPADVPKGALEHEPDNLAIDEVVAATGLAEFDVQHRMALACNLDGRSTVLLAAIARGDVSLSRCTRILDATRLCDPSDVRSISHRLVKPMRDSSRRSHRSFTRELRRQVAIHEPDADTRKADAISRRTAFGELHDDGSGTLTVIGDGERVVAAMERVDAIARALRSGGDERTLAALRSDVALDLIMLGWPTSTFSPDPSTAGCAGTGCPGSRPGSSGPGSSGPGSSGPGSSGPGSSGPGSSGLAGSGPLGSGSAGSGPASSGSAEPSGGTGSCPDTNGASSRASGARTKPDGTQPDGTESHGSSDDTNSVADSAGEDGAAGENEAAGCGCPGTLHAAGDFAPGAWRDLIRVFPPAHVNVVVSLNTLLGLDDAAAEIPGWGFVTGARAQAIALAPGSVWRRLVTDPLTGAAIDLSTRRYRPTAAMSDLVAALDSMCRGPGCTVPAFLCDNDHEIAWPRGRTTIDNLSAKHRRHHNHKTFGTWRSSMDADGVVTWRTMSGRTYVNHRHDYDDALNHPASDAERDIADEIDHPPF